MGFLCFSRSPTIIPARRVYQSRSDADFKVDVDIKCCVHGYLAKDKKQPASLIVFAPQLVCVEDGAFNLFRMEVEFNDQGGSVKQCDPAIVSTAPYSKEESLHEEVVHFKNKTTRIVKKTKKLTATAGAAAVPAQVGLNGTLGSESQTVDEVEYSTRVHYFSKGSSNTRVDKNSARRYGVWWNVKKSTNPQTGDDAGIQPNYLFAVLLRRATDSAPFEAQFRLFAEAGWAHRKEKIIDIIARHCTTTKKKKQLKNNRPAPFRRPLSQELVDFAAGNYEGRPEPMVFEPRIKLEGDCEGIDRLNLGRYQKQEELVKLTMRPQP